MRRVRHWKRGNDARYTLCRQRVPKNPASDGAPPCDRCVDRALALGYTLHATFPEGGQTFRTVDAENADAITFRVTGYSISRVDLPDHLREDCA